MPAHTPVLDFSKPLAARGATNNKANPTYSIGRYGEIRPTLYPKHFKKRTLHVGIDLGAPQGTPVRSFLDGTIIHQGHDPTPRGYGEFLISWHPEIKITALWGHIKAHQPSAHCTSTNFTRDIKKNQIIAHLEAPHKNGSYPPHLHLQLIHGTPLKKSIPPQGVVDPALWPEVSNTYPNPLMVLNLHPLLRQSLISCAL